MATTAVRSSIHSFFRLPSKRTSRDHTSADPSDPKALGPVDNRQSPSSRKRLFRWSRQKEEQSTPDRNDEVSTETLKIVHPTDLIAEERKNEQQPKTTTENDPPRNRVRSKSKVEFHLPNKRDYSGDNLGSKDNPSIVALPERRKSSLRIKWEQSWKGNQPSLNLAGREALQGRRKSTAPGKRADSGFGSESLGLDQLGSQVSAKDFALHDDGDEPESKATSPRDKRQSSGTSESPDSKQLNDSERSADGSIAASEDPKANGTNDMWQIEWFDNERDCRKRTEEILKGRHDESFHRLHSTNPLSPHGSRKHSWISSIHSSEDERSPKDERTGSQDRNIFRRLGSIAEGMQKRKTSTESESIPGSRRQSVWAGLKRSSIGRKRAESIIAKPPDHDGDPDPGSRRLSSVFAPESPSVGSFSRSEGSQQLRRGSAFSNSSSNRSYLHGRHESLVEEDVGYGGDDEAGMSRKLLRR